ncbi:MAG: SCO family protein [Gammaproteobacteria bacterium]|nr:SCO family protein [Gammaproteobacteria bacterium]
MTGLQKTVSLCLAFVVIVLGMLVYKVTRSPQLSLEQLRERDVIVFPRPREIAPFSLLAHTGEPFELEDFEGSWSFVFFGFTHCPDVCPTTLSVMAQAERQINQENSELANGFKGVLVTVDPERDDSETLSRYVGAFSANFTGVGGEPRELARVARQLNIAFAKLPGLNEGYEIEHSGNIVIINPLGHYHGIIRMPHKVDTLVLTYRSLAASF